MTKEEARQLEIDDLVSQVVKVAGDAALNQATVIKNSTAGDDLVILKSELRDRLHSGKNAEDRLVEYQSRS